MHDIRFIRENPAAFDAGLARRGLAPLSAELLTVDEARRAKILAAETAAAAQNAASKDVGAAKARGDDAEFERLRALVAEKKAEGARLTEEAGAEDARLRNALMRIENLPLDEVPDGADESANVEIRRWGTPRVLDFKPFEHFDIPAAKGGLDFQTAAKLSGSRFVVLRGAVARVHRALAQFMLDLHTSEHGLAETWTPVLVSGKTISDAALGKTALGGTGQLPKFRGDLYAVSSEGWRADNFNRIVDEYLDRDALRSALDGNGTIQEVFGNAFENAPTSEEYWLIPTSEATLTNFVSDEILDESTLPIRLTALSQCFRSEAGSGGKDTTGMLRQHQFEKVEMVTICTPETALAEHERMTKCAEAVLERLGLPYRTIVLCTGDMGFGAQKTHDLEVWLPGQNTFREISSVSTCGQFQARRMNARYRPAGGKPEFVATLNGSGLAVGRCLIAVLENGQQADGSVTLPGALVPWLGGKSRITADGKLV